MIVMSDTMTVQVAQRGLLTLPKTLRQSYNIQPGDQLTLLDLGGVFVLSPRRSEIDRLADQLKADLLEQGESLESMLQALREARQRYEA
jgi:bifunctional DNA-binding transcriptional regulator/antitoxin component of YhaV-PrlF toxin-antitoxin module